MREQTETAKCDCAGCWIGFCCIWLNVLNNLERVMFQTLWMFSNVPNMNIVADQHNGMPPCLYIFKTSLTIGKTAVALSWSVRLRADGDPSLGHQLSGVFTRTWPLEGCDSHALWRPGLQGSRQRPTTVHHFGRLLSQPFEGQSLVMATDNWC